MFFAEGLEIHNFFFLNLFRLKKTFRRRRIGHNID